ncbi:sporulation membrane protein YtaF [Virgibacillus xinjiangensis]|uniref:Sporulation membrane protein YtaF n=1 Tax=Virgibacillus xinjiangensis TaxID=393090 RepID=A0ABV7CTE6_9BACI
MLYYTGLFLLVIAVSLDGLGVGITYGMRKIKVPLAALMIIMLCSGIIVLLSMIIGHTLSSFISPEMTQMLGGGILVFLGLFSLYNIIRPEKEGAESSQNILTTVLATPDKADLDRSGIISPGEALLLGAALALDAFGAGIAASMIGYAAALTAALIACMSGLFLYSGMKLGLFLSRNKKLQKMTFLPPVLLITLGVTNML